MFYILGDIREAINKVREFVESELTFFNAFLEEGLRFSLCMFLCLIWVLVLKLVVQNPDEAAKHLKNHPFFKKFVARLSRETYIEGLCNSLQSLCIGLPIKQSSVKCRLSKVLSEECTRDEEDTPVFKKIS